MGQSFFPSSKLSAQPRPPSLPSKAHHSPPYSVLLNQACAHKVGVCAFGNQRAFTSFTVSRSGPLSFLFYIQVHREVRLQTLQGKWCGTFLNQKTLWNLKRLLAKKVPGLQKIVKFCWNQSLSSMHKAILHAFIYVIKIRLVSFGWKKHAINLVQCWLMFIHIRMIL